MGDASHLEGLLLLVDSRMVLVDSQKPKLMVKYQKLVQLNIGQVLVVFVWSDLVGPAIVFVLVAHPVDLLVIVPHFRRHLDLFDTLLQLVGLTDRKLVHLEVGALLGLLNVKFEASALEVMLGRSHDHQVIFIVEAQGNRGDQKRNRAIFDQHSSRSLLVLLGHGGQLTGRVRLQV